MYFEAYKYFSEKTGSLEIGARLARDFQTAMFAGSTLANKEMPNVNIFEWFLDGKEW